MHLMKHGKVCIKSNWTSFGAHQYYCAVQTWTLILIQLQLLAHPRCYIHCFFRCSVMTCLCKQKRTFLMMHIQRKREEYFCSDLDFDSSPQSVFLIVSHFLFVPGKEVAADETSGFPRSIIDKEEKKDLICGGEWFVKRKFALCGRKTLRQRTLFFSSTKITYTTACS